MREEKLRQIEYISVPDSIKNDLGAFKLDPKKKLPVQIPDGQSHLEAKDLTVENIITGMLTIIAYDEAHPNFAYYKSFIEAIEPTLPEELNKAAIAKEQQKDYDFAEELFLAVYHMLPQSASCINLATLYSYMAVDAREKKDEEKEDEYLNLFIDIQLEIMSKKVPLLNRLKDKYRRKLAEADIDDTTRYPR